MSEEEMDADCNETVAAVSSGRFRIADPNSWDKGKRKITRNNSQAREKLKYHVTITGKLTQCLKRPDRY